MGLKITLRTQSYVHYAAVNVAELLETEKSSAMSAVIEDEALKFPCQLFCSNWADLWQLQWWHRWALRGHWLPYLAPVYKEALAYPPM